jgi:hypothetical protein
MPRVGLQISSGVIEPDKWSPMRKALSLFHASASEFESATLDEGSDSPSKIRIFVDPFSYAVPSIRHSSVVSRCHSISLSDLYEMKIHILVISDAC